MVLNNTICYVGKACKYGLVHAADESKVVVQGLDGYIVAEKHGQLLVCSLKEEQRIKEFGKKKSELWLVMMYCMLRVQSVYRLVGENFVWNLSCKKYRNSGLSCLWKGSTS